MPGDTLFRSVFFRRLFIPYLLLIWLAIAGVGAFAAVRLRSVYMASHRDALRDDLQLVSELVRDDVADNRTDELNRRIKALGSEINCRITIIAADGTVLADNWHDPRTMVNHLNRPEISAARSGGEGYRARPSETIHEDMLYLARQLQGQGGQIYYLRLALLLKELGRELWLLYAGLAAFAGLLMLLAGILCYRFARRHTAPIVELTDVAKSLASGDLQRRAMLYHKGEVGDLGQALNTMADSIETLLAETVHGRDELSTIISSIPEGVIATDQRQQILLVNEAAASLLGFQADTARGKDLADIVRIERVNRAAGDVLQRGRKKIVSAGQIAGRHLEIALCTYSPRGLPQGLVLVVHDTTQAVRFQEMRKEFVANVSHELRTPLTMIQGFVETLEDGALADPVKGPQYLGTIRRHTEQLTNLVGDLLELSKLESRAELPKREFVDIGELARKTTALLLPAAQAKRQTLSSEIQPAPPVSGNADYLERAVGNLIDNAIKYTPDGGRISVHVTAESGSTVVEVRDNGIGIPQQDLSRIFERFYRVDRSRSREMGGTGLGLAIVKHVAQVHGGSVQVESEVGKGSTFRLTLRAAGTQTFPLEPPAEDQPDRDGIEPPPGPR